MAIRSHPTCVLCVGCMCTVPEGARIQELFPTCSTDELYYTPPLTYHWSLAYATFSLTNLKTHDGLDIITPDHRLLLTLPLGF
jgi:hypothetical protein